MIESGLKGLDASFIMVKTGLEAWDRIQSMSDAAMTEGKTIKDKVALVLTDLEMPEMDGFTLTRNLKNDERFHSATSRVDHADVLYSLMDDVVKNRTTQDWVGYCEKHSIPCAEVYSGW